MIKDFLRGLDIELSDVQQVQFNTYFEYLSEQNKVMNLTAITEMKDVYYKHFYDSVSLVKAIDFNDIKTICDIGAGAGFPSIPLKIIYPHLTVTIVESLQKRIGFLTRLSLKLNMDGIELISNRAEIFAANNRNRFDLVTARAVAPIKILDELALPMVKKGGYLIAMKATNFEVELNEARNGIGILGGKVRNTVSFELPYDYGERHLLVIEKVKINDNFPRSYAQIKKKPL